MKILTTHYIEDNGKTFHEGHDIAMDYRKGKTVVHVIGNIERIVCDALYLSDCTIFEPGENPRQERILVLLVSDMIADSADYIFTD